MIMGSLRLWAISGLSWPDVWSWLRLHAWMVVGLLGQAVFTARFVVQWLASERKKDSVMPTAFWWLSLGGGLITLVYALHLQSLPFALGQSMGLFVYIRNLMLVSKKKRRAAKKKRREEEAAALADAPVHNRHRPHPHHRRVRSDPAATGE
jgi:lipid-A-disaccharide synthase-like uncharacterized protein